MTRHHSFGNLILEKNNYWKTMRLIILVLAVLAAAAYADVSELNNEYLPPSTEGPVEPEPAHTLSDDGYQYKTVRRLKYRHRRDVNELLNNEYLPPVSEDVTATEAPVTGEPEPAHELAEDGYRYKTVRRLKYRHRRDVNELPNNEYLPPASEDVTATEAPVTGEPEPAHELAEDGYRYKTVRRLKYRHRRDVNELLNNEYLPPVSEDVTASEAPVTGEPEPAHELAEDGYRYKTVRRLKYRHRRDVNELLNNEYLPPVSEDLTATEAPVTGEPEPAHELAEDGYRYKTVRRLRYRHRRDVNELPNNEYLPPASEDATATEAPLTGEPEPAHELAEDGYRYKTVRRLKYRHRRDVNELLNNEYLPPVSEDLTATEAPVTGEPEPAHELAEDGYRYKTVRRLRYRHRRDVNELPNNEYLPPASEDATATEAPVTGEPEPAHELAEDGYRYKTVRRLKYRHRRDVNELLNNEYLPPVSEDLTATEAPVTGEPEPAHELAEDGYRYKTVRRLRYRHRRDVNELPNNEYLPPASEDATATEPSVTGEPEPAHELAEDGYRYKTVRQIRYRIR